MSVILIRRSFEHAQNLIKNFEYEYDNREEWSLHRPTRGLEKRFINEHGLSAFALWHLAEDNEIEERSLKRYKFPYGDFHKVHRCAVLAAESGAMRNEYYEVQTAAVYLHGMLEELRRVGSQRRVNALSH